MNCEEARGSLSDPSNEEAKYHLQTCPECRIWLMSNRSDQRLDPRIESEIINRLTAELKPVRPIRSKSRNSVFLLVTCICIIAIGIAALGTRGWTATDVTLRAIMSATIAIGVTLGAFLLPGSFIPGDLVRLRPSVIAVVTFSLLFSTFYRPVLMYPGFARAAVTCVIIGVIHAVIAGGIAHQLLRPGFPLSPVRAFLLIGYFAGLCGFAVLFVFCPHMDLAHHFVAHAGMLFLSMAVGIGIALSNSRLICKLD
jgi:hypothetical protein